MTTASIQLTASDGHQCSAFIAEPQGAPVADLILLQEIFGITAHMQKLATDFAGYGFRAIVPALFDRVERNLVISYADADRGRAIAQQCEVSCVLKDIDAARKYAGNNRPVAVIGYCWGGTFAYLAAAKLEVGAAVSYYGTRVADNLQTQLNAPVQFHIGADDKMIPEPAIAKIMQAHPNQSLWIYENAGHAFACEDRAAYEPISSKLAKQRTLEFLAQQLGLSSYLSQ
jgi:carboxymethylenebutenolidase